jgi:hypothetical protein
MWQSSYNQLLDKDYLNKWQLLQISPSATNLDTCFNQPGLHNYLLKLQTPFQTSIVCARSAGYASTYYDWGTAVQVLETCSGQFFNREFWKSFYEVWYPFNYISWHLSI